MPATNLRAIIDGIPGEYWENDTDYVWYQVTAAGINTCGLCWQMDGKIARYWALPFHGHCRCRISVVKPGATAPRPFVDYKRAVAALPADQQAAVMGKSVYRLVQAKVIDWAEAVTAGRIRTLEELVARNRLSVARLIKAGVQPGIAERAHVHVNTPEHVIVEAKRRDLIDRIMRAGTPQQDLSRQLAERLAARVSIAAGPTYTTKAGVVIPGIQAQPLVPPPEAVRPRREHIELSAILSMPVATARAAMMKAPTISARNRAIIAAELGGDAARSVSDFLATVADKIRRGEVVSDAVMALYRRLGGSE